MLFYLTLVLIPIEMLIMSSLRVSMAPLTAYLHSLFTLVLGLYHKNSIPYLIGHILFGVLGDLTFTVLKIMNRYEIMPIQYSYNTAYNLILFILLIGTIFVRMAMIFFYFSFKNAYYKDNTIHYFSAFKNQFGLQPVQCPQSLDVRHNINSV